MRVSQYYQLNRSQPSLDFVDVDIYGDLKVFVDPRALRLLPSSWGGECVSLIQSFFHTVLQAIKNGEDEKAQKLLSSLREPNETHLGLSHGKARGRALGDESARDVWQALRQSEAVISGLLEDLEDSILLIEGIDKDIISDISTNIIREPLIRYTQDACMYYGIPLEPEVYSGPLWDPMARAWYTDLVEMPVANGQKLLLVPKVIVRHILDYNADEYYRHYLLEYLREKEMSANTELVQLLKNGTRRVTKKSLMEKYGRGKAVILRETLQHPDVLYEYRADKKAQGVRPPLTHMQIAEAQESDPPDWDELLEEVISLEAGRADATLYEKAVEQLLTALFYPALVNPQIQHEIHEGRKRIDITYTNAARYGFFNWLATHYPSAHVFVECKNYTREIGNPELDQLAGRFSPSRGQFGLLIGRNFDDKEQFLRRCRDTARDVRGYIIPLDDNDLENLVLIRKSDEYAKEFSLLKSRFDKLIM